LRNIALVPHQEIYRRTGLKCCVFYRHWTLTHFNVSTGPPDPAWFEDIVRRCPSLTWGGEVRTYAGLGRFVNLGVRLGLRLISRSPVYFPFELRLTDEERAALPAPTGRLRVAVQTHLSGMKTKQWGVANWSRYLAALLEAEPEIEIFLFDGDERVQELCLDERIRSTSRYAIAQSIVFLQSCDLLISIDSWTKYIAAAHRIPQVLVVPDQRTEYPQLTPEKLLGVELAGIYGRADTDALGISSGPPPQLTLASIDQLTPDELLVATLRRLTSLRRG
jgi:ADP-heptose:LPS heptosyltransferase